MYLATERGKGKRNELLLQKKTKEELTRRKGERRREWDENK
jgi:hypothetical protein